MLCCERHENDKPSLIWGLPRTGCLWMIFCGVVYSNKCWSGYYTRTSCWMKLIFMRTTPYYIIIFTCSQTLNTVRKLCKMENFSDESFMNVFHFSELSIYGYRFLSCRLVCNSFIDFMLLFPVKSLSWGGLGIKDSLLIGW